VRVAQAMADSGKAEIGCQAIVDSCPQERR
jgi:hypothetical protein